MTELIERRIQAQLDWLCDAPNLIEYAPLAIPRALFTKIPLPLIGAQVNARRLGLQFEQLVRIYLQNNPQTTDIDNNITVRSAHTTYGEADLLFKYANHWWHLELALKFYLRQTNIEGLAGYFGPNRRDRFDIKWAHMLSHQTKILEHPMAQPILEQRKISRVHTAALVKGWVFQHPNDARTDRPAPINPAHERGWWVHQSELRNWLKQFPHNASYLLVEKPFWLYPLRFIGQIELNSSQLCRKVEQQKSAAQIWVIIGTGISRQLLSRGYVVADDWEQY